MTLSLIGKELTNTGNVRERLSEKRSVTPANWLIGEWVETDPERHGPNRQRRRTTGHARSVTALDVERLECQEHISILTVGRSIRRSLWASQ